MRYWLLTTEYPPFFGGGIGTYCATTARMLSEKKHDVTVFISDATVNDIRVEKNEGIRLVRFNTSRTNSSSFLGHVTNISYEFAHIVKHFIEREGQPDIIEAQEYQGIAYYLLQYKYLLYEWCRDVPVLITMHSPSSLYMEYNHVPMHRYPNFWICEMEYFCLQAASYIISPSNYMLKELERKFVLTNKNVTIISNPFEGKLNNIKAVPAITGKVNEIVFYGKLTVQKGVLRLLNYFKELWDRKFDRPLYLIGGQDIVYHPEGITMGDLIRKKYKEYITRGLLKLEDRIKPSEISARLSRAEVVIIPSDNDNLPYVVLEMMALGKIVLASKQGGQSEIIENETDGFIFDHAKPDTFFKQLDFILNLDEAQRKNISSLARQKVEQNYNLDAVYQQKIKLIEQILNNKGASLPAVFPFIRKRQKEIKDTNRSIKPGKLSIVVPFYNMGQYIDETIQSLLQCNYADKEILIINDGSTDKHSLQKLDGYRLNSSLKVIDIKNGGLANARNTGAEKADGEFLAFLDADDKVQQNYYTQAIGVLRQYTNVHFAGCWVKYFGNSDNIWPAFMPEPPLILNHNTVNSSSLVYKREAFLKAGKNDPTMLFQGYEDYESVIAMLAAEFGGVVIPEPLFHYRVRTGSMYRKISRSKKLSLYQHICEKHGKYYAGFATDLFNLLNANGPGILLDNPSTDHHLTDNLPFNGKLSVKVIALMKRNRIVKRVAYKAYKLIKKKR